MLFPEVVERVSTVVSPWVTLAARHVRLDPDQALQVFHSLQLADYVCTLAITSDGRVPVVRQYRPALECITMELPAGLRDGDEEPQAAAERELLEEAGLRAGRVEFLGCLDTDSGRLENRIWYYAALEAEPVAGWRPEPGVAVEFLSREDFRAAILDGRFRHSLHVAPIGLALLRGLL